MSISLPRSNSYSRTLAAFFRQESPSGQEQFLQVSTKVLPRLKIVIGKAVWEQRGDIRGDVISIGKLVWKNDGPKEAEQILRTMAKYREMKEL